MLFLHPASMSSRSHAIFTIVVEHSFSQEGTKVVTVGKLVGGPWGWPFLICQHLVDLAGSERYEASEGKQDRLQEAININTSLTTLGKVCSDCSSTWPHDLRWCWLSHCPTANTCLTATLS